MWINHSSFLHKRQKPPVCGIIFFSGIKKHTSFLGPSNAVYEADLKIVYLFSISFHFWLLNKTSTRSTMLSVSDRRIPGTIHVTSPVVLSTFDTIPHYLICLRHLFEHFVCHLQKQLLPQWQHYYIGPDDTQMESQCIKVVVTKGEPQGNEHVQGSAND